MIINKSTIGYIIKIIGITDDSGRNVNRKNFILVISVFSTIVSYYEIKKYKGLLLLYQTTVMNFRYCYNLLTSVLN